MAIQVFTSSGSIAFLPFDKKTGMNYSLIWSADIGYAGKLLSLNKSDFISKLQDEVGSFFGSFTLKGEITARVNQFLTKGQVKGAYFTEFIIQ